MNFDVQNSIGNASFKLSYHYILNEKRFWTKVTVENATKLIKYTQHLNRDCSTRHLTKHSEGTYIFSKGETINPFSQVLKLGIIPVLFLLFLLKLRKQQRSIKSRKMKFFIINTLFPSRGLKKAPFEFSSLALANQPMQSSVLSISGPYLWERKIYIFL